MNRNRKGGYLLAATISDQAETFLTSNGAKLESWSALTLVTLPPNAEIDQRPGQGGYSVSFHDVEGEPYEDFWIEGDLDADPYQSSISMGAARKEARFDDSPRANIGTSHLYDKEGNRNK